ncbi:HIRAN domain-containing protein [Methylobacterium sp. SyP6R]|uniref:HIRAN domain-containing protein n=1 Tax=Methylobacterium sp. SyP6R TaxID=2718876 RepID=UPI001F1D7667|nr:HIRAN domain-containing protein [Methylobacterium sp. SyP6R]MCF4127887.1 HIRAN domain-containing protein [Methylobacterium sp. SyP6R]
MTDSPFEVPGAVLLEGADAAIEADRIRAGEPWAACEIAGLQFYDYSTEGLDGEPVRPRAGDRLVLVRAPENRYDPRAVEVWWRNDIRLGHLPRGVAREVAPHMDAGAPLRAYVSDPGTGEAWSARALLVGPAVGELHGKLIAHATAQALDEWRWGERLAEMRREGDGRARGARFERRLELARAARLAQAVNVFSAKLPPEPIDEARLPPAGKCVELFDIAHAVGCSRSTARRLAERAGVRVQVSMRGWYAASSTVVVTDEFRTVLAEWASRPRRRVTVAELV